MPVEEGHDSGFACALQAGPVASAPSSGRVCCMWSRGRSVKWQYDASVKSDLLQASSNSRLVGQVVAEC
jgi:hypothetical protein